MTDINRKAWERYHQENPKVWALFERFTLEAINAGFQHYSTNSIIERIRWHTNIETRGDMFKINNNHAPYYAREFHKRYPQHDGFFRMRNA